MDRATPADNFLVGHSTLAALPRAFFLLEEDLNVDEGGQPTTAEVADEEHSTPAGTTEAARLAAARARIVSQGRIVQDRLHGWILLSAVAVVPCLFAAGLALYLRLAPGPLPDLLAQIIHKHEGYSPYANYFTRSRDGAYVMSVAAPNVTRWATADVDPLTPGSTPVTEFQCQNSTADYRVYANNAFFGFYSYETYAALTVCYVGEDGGRALPSRYFVMTLAANVSAYDFWMLAGAYDAGSGAVASDPVTVFVSGLSYLYQFRISLVDQNFSLVDTFPYLTSNLTEVTGHTLSVTDNILSDLYCTLPEWCFLDAFPFVPDSGRSAADKDMIYRGFNLSFANFSAVLLSIIDRQVLVQLLGQTFLLDLGSTPTPWNFSETYNYASVNDSQVATQVTPVAKYYPVQPTLSGDSLVFLTRGESQWTVNQVNLTQPTLLMTTRAVATNFSFSALQDAFVVGTLPRAGNVVCIYGTEFGSLNYFFKTASKGKIDFVLDTRDTTDSANEGGGNKKVRAAADGDAAVARAAADAADAAVLAARAAGAARAALEAAVAANAATPAAATAALAAAPMAAERHPAAAAVFSTASVAGVPFAAPAVDALVRALGCPGADAAATDAAAAARASEARPLGSITTVADHGHSHKTRALSVFEHDDEKEMKSP
ncbi:hypothetical protein HK405_010470, partial [Cladochytrium tenue]